MSCQSHSNQKSVAGWAVAFRELGEQGYPHRLITSKGWSLIMQVVSALGHGG